MLYLKVAQRCCGTPARVGKNLVRNTQKRQKIVRSGAFYCLGIAKIVRNMNRSRYACATLTNMTFTFPLLSNFFFFFRLS